MPPAKGVTNRLFQLLLEVGGRPFISQDFLKTPTLLHRACNPSAFELQSPPHSRLCLAPPTPAAFLLPKTLEASP